MPTDDDYRRALSTFATGIAVVATSHKGCDYALTINSFMSVSLQPRLVLWSLQSDSKVYDIFSGAEFFTISILADEQRAISDRYAFSSDFRLLEQDSMMSSQELPSVRDSLAIFNCRQEQVVLAGDHELILAEVNSFRRGDSPSDAPLIFYHSNYSKLAADTNEEI